MSHTHNTIDDLAALDDFDQAEVKPADSKRGFTDREKARLEAVGGARSVSDTFYEETCDKCRGSGRFVSWAGRDVGPCHACKGKGVRRYRTSKAQREAAREQRQARELRKAQARVERANEWLQDNPERAAWLHEASARGFEFATDLLAKLVKYGPLSQGQVDAIDRCVARDRDRNAARSAAQAAADEAGFDLKGLPSGRYAIERPDQDPLLVRVDNVDRGKWSGWVFVKGEPEGDRLGRQKPGHAYQGKHAQELASLAQDPLAAAKLYGRTTGVCCICGRTLTNPESIDNGIGPICAQRF